MNAVPCSFVGTRLDNSSFSIATALRLGVPICAPHQWVCGENIDQYGVRGLSCRRSAGRHSRHSAVNDLIKRALTAAEIPARLEPSCLSRNDGKRPAWAAPPVRQARSCRTTFERGTARQAFAVPYFSKKNHKHIGDLVLLI